MKEIIFSIRGNQNDPQQGNPIPYKRTLAGKFRADSIEYFDWKEYVRAEFSRRSHIRYPDHDNSWQSFKTQMMAWKKEYYPIIVEKGERARVEMMIYHGARRGDGDNIFKGILDALFANDACVWAGSFECHPSEKPRVEVTIYVEKDIPSAS